MKPRNLLRQEKEIGSHLQQLADRQVRLKVFSAKGAFLSRGWIVRNPGSGGRIAISPLPIGAIDTSGLICRYVMDERLFTFTTRPLGNENGYLSIAVPTAIRFQNRRTHYRVSPGIDAPVFARIHIPDTGVVLRPVLDISASGFSVLLPYPLECFGKGISLPVHITLPGNTGVQCTGLVKNKSAFMHVRRIGFSFHGIAERNTQKVQAYCRKRLTELEDGNEDTPVDMKKIKVAVIDSGGRNPSLSYLEDRFTVKSTEHLNAIKLFRGYSPELIIIDMAQYGARLVTKTISRDPGLKYLPVVCLGQKPVKMKGRPGAVETVRSPYTRECLMETVRNLVARYRMAEDCEKNAWKLFTGEGKKIMVLCPEKNLRRLHCTLLENDEYPVFRATDELDIVQRITSIMPDVIVLDDETEPVDPATLCRLINLNKTLRSIPKIRMVPGGMEGEEAVFDGSGVTFLKKPLSYKRLADGINRALGRSPQKVKTEPL